LTESTEPTLQNKRERGLTYLAMFCLAWAMMTLQLTQTRILSWIYYNHVVYLTVTIALLGFGVSGVVIALVAKQGRRLEVWTLAAAGGFAVSIPACIRLASLSTTLFDKTGEQLKLLFCYGVLVVPFVFAGAAIGLLLLQGAKRVHNLYFVDLAASGIGALGFTLLLRPLGAPALIWAASACALVAFVAYGLASAAPLKQLAVPPLLLGGALVLWGGGLLAERVEPYKFLAKLHEPGRPDVRLERSEWSPIARIDIFSDSSKHLFTGRHEEAATFKVLTQDADALSVLPGEAWRANVLRESDPTQPITPHNFGYVVRPKPEDALIIGIGGGIDVVSAQAFGAKHIVAAEINPVTVDLMRHDFRDYLKWPSWPNVDLRVGEGRHLVRSGGKQYDTITMAAVDTFSALSSGAYVLSENYLYTVEALEDYLNALKPRGVMTVFRWLFRQPRESLRFSNLFMEAAERRGIREPSKCIMVVAANYNWEYRWAATMIRNEPFSPEEVEAVLARVRGRPDLAVVYLPNVFSAERQGALEAELFAKERQYYEPARSAFGKVIKSSAPQRRQFERDYQYRIDPVWDDRPFFFEYHKLGEVLSPQPGKELDLRGVGVHYVLYLLLVVATVVATVAILGPLYWLQRGGLSVTGVRDFVGLFACLGVGFMFLELGMIQRLNLYLGHPTYSLSVVLAGLLLFTGLGSHQAGKLTLSPGRLLVLGTAVPAGLSLVWLLVMSLVIGPTLAWPLGVRIAVVLVSLFPIGLALGVPFATALRYVDGYDRRFVPWAWGINGLASIVASVLSVLLAMRIGFTWVILLGTATYGVAYLIVRRHFSRRAPG
jgi:spermidine synthase